MDTIIHKQFPETVTTPQPAPTSLRSAGAGVPSSFIPPPSSFPRQRWLTMATDSVDRAGDILLLSGMDAENFLRNPQFLWQHGASGSIINTIGKVLELRVGAHGNAPNTNGRTMQGALPSTSGGLPSAPTALYALVEYASPELSPLAEHVYQMDLAGLLPANSIGFRPIEYEANEFGGYTFTKWELIECSKVELPMNPEAVDSEKWITDSDQFQTPEQAADWLLS